MKNNKPLGGRSYGSIPHLIGSKLGEHDKNLHEGQHNILTKKSRDKHDVIYVTEKYDGSNVAIAKVDGKIIAITRSGYLASTSPYDTHHAFDYWVKKNSYMLSMVVPNNHRLCCEWMHKRHSLSYDYLMNTQDELIVCFDLINNNDKRRLSYRQFFSMDTGTIAKPRLIHIGNPIQAKDLITDLNAKDYNHKIICREIPEGMVYRCERKGEFDFMGKWVRDDFEAGKYLDLNR